MSAVCSVGGRNFVHDLTLRMRSCLRIARVDDDECEASTDDCHTYATCYNTPASYKCVCNEGFTGNGFNCQGSVYLFV